MEGAGGLTTNGHEWTRIFTNFHEWGKAEGGAGSCLRAGDVGEIDDC